MEFAFLSSVLVAYQFFAAKRASTVKAAKEAVATAATVLTSVPPRLPVIAASGEAAQLETYHIPHLNDIFGPTDVHFSNPLLVRAWPRNNNFIAHGDCVIDSQVILSESAVRSAREALEVRKVPRSFALVGPFERLEFDPVKVKSAIVTCGGLCPGLNTVIRDIVMCMTYVYGTQEIWGVSNGYRGFYDGTPWRILSPDYVSDIHNQGGTTLGSSRGGFDANKILDACDSRGINVLFIIGGDGTHRGILELVRTAAARRSRIVIAGVPKTIDNDIPIIDKTFGFDTAVEKAVGPISSAHVEAKAAPNGVGLVKLMGRSAGFIAAHASMASQDVNLVLIPEAPWRLEKVLSWLEGRLKRRGHAVIVVAEGAESEEMKAIKDEDARSPGPSTASPAAGHAAAPRCDESGNIIPDDVGQYLKDAITKHFKSLDNCANVKYIDPSYIIRSSAPNASDSNLCTNLAYNVVHGALAGYTGFTVGTVENHFVMLPIAVLSVMKPKTIDLTGRFYSRLCATTGQPSCM